MAHPVIPGAVKPRLQVAAIDFGTTFSGYAFSFQHDFKEDPLKIVTNQWTKGSGRNISLKTSSCILFDPQKRFHSFGFDAEDMYAELAVEENHVNWFFFRHFKMMLYENQELGRTTMITDDKGNRMPALTVFSESIKFLRHHFLDSCSDRQYGLNEDEIHWVLTVPAIWDDSAKQFMREAAINAGISTDNLSLALEPEAASMYCKYLPVNRIKGVKNDVLSCFRPATRYIVLDAGGGTVDITVHETQPDGTVRELFKANGGPWGGTKVDEAFNQFLVDISSKETIETLKMSNTEDYLEMMREFEIKKTMTSPELDQKVTFKIPIALHETYAKIHGDELRTSRLVQEPLRQNISFLGDKLRLQPMVVQGFFDEVCDNITNHLKDIFNKREVSNTDTILMVGGFSESPMLQAAVRKTFPDKTVVIPAEAGLAVLKGAVIFGHAPSFITKRVARYTYGVRMYAPFDPSKHDEARRRVVDGKEYCAKVFDKHVSIGEEVVDGCTFKAKDYVPVYTKAKHMTLQVYTSSDANPSFIDESGCIEKGCVDVDYSGVDLPEDKTVNVRMQYGDTELHVEATIVKTGEKVNAKFDFL